MNDEALSQVFSAMSTPRRVALVRLLAGSETPLTLTTLVNLTGLPKTSVSHDLDILASVGLISKIPSGRFVLHRINRASFFEVIRFFRRSKGTT